MVPRIPPPIYIFASKVSNVYSIPVLPTRQCAITLSCAVGGHQAVVDMTFDAHSYSIKRDAGMFYNAQTLPSFVETMRLRSGYAVSVEVGSTVGSVR